MPHSFWNHDYHTETAGTAITEVIPASGPVGGRNSRQIKVNYLRYRVAATAHTLTFMRAVASTLTTASAASGQKVIALETLSPGNDTSGDPEDIAASDFLSWIDDDGVYGHDIVASVSGNNVTMTANLVRKIAKGATVWWHGEVGRATHVVYNSSVSQNFELRDSIAGIANSGIRTQTDIYNKRSGRGDTMIFHSNNITAAGFLEALSGVYTAHTAAN